MCRPTCYATSVYILYFYASILPCPSFCAHNAKSPSCPVLSGADTQSYCTGSSCRQRDRESCGHLRLSLSSRPCTLLGLEKKARCRWEAGCPRRRRAACCCRARSSRAASGTGLFLAVEGALSSRWKVSTQVLILLLWSPLEPHALGLLEVGANLIQAQEP